jgi:hypothetical protein
MGTQQQFKQWEKEACAYADRHIGKPMKDFEPYTTAGGQVSTSTTLTEGIQQYRRMKVIRRLRK